MRAAGASHDDRLRPPRPGELTAVHLPGRLPYLPLWDAQRRLAAARRQGEIGDLLLLLEHSHVYTNGRNGDRGHLLADEATLARLGASYHAVDRGGDITYHGPGQLVGYAILDLRALGIGVRRYIELIEAALARTAASFGIEARGVPGYTGLWAGDEKLAAIGVRVSRGIAYHGFALNVAPDLAYFAHIVPCGIRDRGVTSLTRLLGRAVAVEEVVPVCAESLAAGLGLDLRWESSLPGEMDGAGALAGRVECGGLSTG